MASEHPDCQLLVRKEVHQDAGAVKIEQPTLLGKIDRTTYICSVTKCAVLRSTSDDMLNWSPVLLHSLLSLAVPQS